VHASGVPHLDADHVSSPAFNFVEYNLNLCPPISPPTSDGGIRTVDLAMSLRVVGRRATAGGGDEIQPLLIRTQFYKNFL
jgi:hypothetical protein